jgi:hypothetical protein
MFNATAKIFLGRLWRATVGSPDLYQFPECLSVLEATLLLPQLGFLPLFGPEAALSEVAVRANRLAHTWAQ